MKITKIAGFFAFMIIAAVCAGCGSSGSSSSSDNTSNDTTMTSADVHNIGAGLYNSQSAAFTAIMNQFATDSTKSAESMAVDLAKGSKSGTIPINEVFNCQTSGHITSTGNFNWTYTYPDPPDYVAPESSVTIRGQLMQQVSDPTNNLNDCEQAGGVIMDGTIYSQLTYDWTQSAGGRAVWSTDGTLGFNRRGPTGGLVMIASDCSIFFSITINVSASGASSGSASGTICGQSYSFTF